MVSIEDAPALVIGPDGNERSFGEFLRDQRKACRLPVTKIVERAGMSRANYYLLEGDRQRPSLPTVVSLFGAMGLATRVPMTEDPELAKDLVVQIGDDAYMVDLQWSPEERKKSRDRYWSATDSGLGALGGLAGLGAAGAALGAAGFVAAPLLPAAAIGGAILLAARRQAQRRMEDAAAAKTAPSQEDVLSDLNDVAESMTTEELEALLAAMKAMKEARDVDREDQ